MTTIFAVALGRTTLSRRACGHSRYHLQGSPGASGLPVPQLSTLLLSAFLGESVFSPAKASLPRDQLNLLPHHPFPMAERTWKHSTLTHHVKGRSLMPPPEAPQGQRAQDCSTQPEYAQWPTPKDTATVELPLEPGRVDLPHNTQSCDSGRRTCSIVSQRDQSLKVGGQGPIFLHRAFLVRLF